MIPLAIIIVVGVLIVAAIALSSERSPSRPVDAQPASAAPRVAIAEPPPVVADARRAPAQQAMLQREYERKQAEVRARMDGHKRHIAAAMQRAEIATQFEYLRDFHTASRRTADQAYLLMDDAKHRLSTIGNTIVNVAKQRDAYTTTRSARASSRSHELDSVISQLWEVRGALTQQKDTIKAQRDYFRTQVEGFNGRTRELKLAIRTGSGGKGRAWYEALEERTRRRREWGAL